LGRNRAHGLSLRATLIVLVLVPSVALATLWVLSVLHLADDWRVESSQSSLADRVGPPVQMMTSALQRERTLTAQALADPSASRAALTAQRRLTDKAVPAVTALTALDTTHGQDGLAQAIEGAVRPLSRLADERHAVDSGTARQQRAYDYYTGAVTAQLNLVDALDRGADGEALTEARPLIDLVSAMEMTDRVDALLVPCGHSCHLPYPAYGRAVDAIATQKYLLGERVAPALHGDEVTQYRELTSSKEWVDLTAQEDRLLKATTAEHRGGEIAVAWDEARWRSDLPAVQTRLQALLDTRLASVSAIVARTIAQPWRLLVTATAIILVAVVLVVALTWRMSHALRGRVLALRQEAQELRTRLPEVIERLANGEEIDVDAEAPTVEYAGDELAELGTALNLARRSAVTAAVDQARQHRGFELLLQRLARRTQLLIGMQLKKIDEMERRHEDAEVLEGLFDLDHLTARLRRYEENLVILGGGQPQRRWRRPVALLDLLRAAQGEVQDYRRISIDVAGSPALSQRAVGPLIHILAELMENAASFSKPPMPVEVRAGLVGHGIVVEIEDRGLGMEGDQYAAANALMRNPPQLDVMTRADDVRLGLYVVARLAGDLGVRVELGPSAFGGTRVVVLVPGELVTASPAPVGPAEAGAPAEGAPEETAAGPAPQPAWRLRPSETSAGPRPEATREDASSATPVRGPWQYGRLPARTRGRAMAAVTSATDTEPGTDQAALPAPEEGPSRPLPQRVRQASLVAELREPDGHQPERTEWAPPTRPRRSGAAVAAFQRQSRLARNRPETGAAQAPPTSSTTEDDRS
jgi:hypothetical protein